MGDERWIKRPIVSNSIGKKDSVHWSTPSIISPCMFLYCAYVLVIIVIVEQSVSSLSLYSEYERGRSLVLLGLSSQLWGGILCLGPPRGLNRFLLLMVGIRERLIHCTWSLRSYLLTVSILYSTRINALISTCMYSKICVIHCNKIYSTLLCVCVFYCILPLDIV